MKLIQRLLILTIITVLCSCVQESQSKTITVKLDMTAIEKHSQVGIRGEYPLSWEETTYLSDTNNDGIYEETFNIYSANNSIEFKFVNENDQFELEDQNNRILNFEYKPETILIEATFNNPETKITKY